MPQVLKEEVRDRIVNAAEVVFAARGYRGATMAAIAERAGLSTGNLYRYFRSKSGLFEHMLGPGFVETFDRLLEERVASLSAQELTAPSDPAREADARMLRFWFAHRLRVVVLLDRAEGSTHAGFGPRFVARLSSMVATQLERELGRSLSDAAALMLEQIFETSRRSVVAILERYEDEDVLLEAFAAFRSYQLAGLAGFRRWIRS